MQFITPIKITFSGDVWHGRSYIKFACAQLAILEQQMMFQKLNEGKKIVSPINGIVIECLSKFGHHEVKIYVESIINKNNAEIISINSTEIISVLMPEFPIIPLIAIGQAELDSINNPGIYSNAHSYGYLRPGVQITGDPFTQWVSPNTENIPTAYSCLQVRYLTETAVFDNGITTTEKNITFSLRLSRDENVYTIVITALEYIPSTDEDNFDNLEALTNVEFDISTLIEVLPGRSVHIFKKQFDGGINPLFNVAANFNTDKTKLYVVAWDTGIDDLYPVASAADFSSSGTVYVYARSLVDGVITWTEETNQVITASYAMAGAFIDNEGFLHGLHRIKIIEPNLDPPECRKYDSFSRYEGKDCWEQVSTPEFKCVKLDLKDLGITIVDTAYTSIGTTIRDGDFAPMILDISTGYQEPYIEGTGGCWNPSEVNQIGSCLNDLPWDPNNPETYEYWEFWPTYVGFMNTEISGKVSCGCVPERHTIPGQAWNSVFSFVDFIGNSLGHFSVISIENTTYTKEEVYSGTGFGSSNTSQSYSCTITSGASVNTNFGSIVYDYGLTVNEYYVPLTTESIDYMLSSEYLISTTTNDPSIIYPIAITNAIGYSGFIAYDQNQLGSQIFLEIRGVRYLDKSDDIVKNKISINGVFMSDIAMIRSGIIPGTIQSLGFLF